MRLFHVDAFTGMPFHGNPAAVCILEREREAAWMESLAAEMFLPETAYVLRRDDGWSLRWFAPDGEIALCGHATLASAHVLWNEELLLQEEVARFHTMSGLLSATRDGDLIELDFPATPEERIEPPAVLIEALGADVIYAGKSRFDYIVEVASEAIVRGMSPDHRGLHTLPARGVIVTSRAADDVHDFVSRFFGARSAIDEDPVTGSAHCCLTPFWAERLAKRELLAYQASPRGGTLRVRLDGERVRLAGRAVTISAGELFV